MGSKAKIVPSLAMNLPPATHFYDLFGGGFSVTHYMMEHKASRYKHFHYNEIKADVVELVKRAIAGEYNYKKFKPPWVSREDFFRLKDHDAYVRCCWSFGNDQKTYLFGEDIEAYKKSMHMAVVFDQFDPLAAEVLGFEKWPFNVISVKQKRIYLRQKIEFYRKTKIPRILHQFLSEKQLQTISGYNQVKELEQLERLERLQELQQLERLERLQQLEQLEQLEQLQQLTCTSKDYREVEILPDSIVYCDIPYQGTADYGAFNHKEFFDWAATREFPVYISEYNISDKRFKLVYDIDKRSLLSSNKNKCVNKSEKLYWNQYG
jgi:site-specific DNA-adenine methylase